MGQEPGMWHITDEDGLPSMTVYQTAQDEFGYIWIGTEKGICRFDGRTFKYYKSEEFNDSEILKIEIDVLGRIWFLNLSRQLFYIEDELIYNAKQLLGDENGLIKDFTLKDDTVWVSFEKTLKGETSYMFAHFSFDSKGGFLPLTINDELFFEVSTFIRLDQSVYVYTYSKGRSKVLAYLEEKTGKLIEKEYFSQKEDHLFSILVHEENMYAIAKNGNDIVFEQQEGIGNLLIEFKDEININELKIFEDKFWILSFNGIYIEPINKSVINRKPDLLNNIPCNRMMVDREGNKWISTTGNGIYVITAEKSKVFLMSNFNLPSKDIYSLEYDSSNKRLLAGHSNGMISVIDEQLNNEVVSINTPGRVVDIVVDQNGTYWCGSDTKLVALNSDLNFIGTKRHVVKKILEIGTDTVLITNYCCVMKMGKDAFYKHEEGRKVGFLETIFNKKTYGLFQDFSDKIWLGTIEGLYIYDETVEPFLEDGKHVSYSVTSIVQANDSIIWVGTRADGLLGIKENKIFVRLKKKDGLASNTIKEVKVWGRQLWIATDNGLNKLNLKNKKLETINKNDGLPSNEVFDIEIVDHNVWVGTAKGLVSFSVDTDHTNHTPPLIHVSGIKLEEVDTMISDKEQVFDLPYYQNSIQVDFTGIAYKGKGEISYSYKMSGADEDWVSTSSQFARYPNLPPGDYTFKVFAYNEDQVKSLSPAKVSFFIRAPWWNTLWFRILAFIVIVTIISLMFIVSLNRRKRERRFKNQLNELKTQALRSQMNPHFIFNALNAIQKFLTTNNREQAMHYLSRFGKLIRAIFEQSQREKVSLEEELEFLNLYLDLEKLRFMDRVDIQLKVSEELLEISDEINIPPLLIQPIIENSFKHGFLYKKELGVLKINFFKEEDYLVCTVEDNGIGRKRAAELGQQYLEDRSSSGLKTAKERLSINNVKKGETFIDRSGLRITDLKGGEGEFLGTLVKVNIYCKELAYIEEL